MRAFHSLLETPMKKWLLATLALAFTHAYAADSLLERINAHGTVTIGTEGTYAPFTYHDESGKLTGYDVEVARAVAAKLGFTLAKHPDDPAMMTAVLAL